MLPKQVADQHGRRTFPAKAPFSKSAKLPRNGSGRILVAIAALQLFTNLFRR